MICWIYVNFHKLNIYWTQILNNIFVGLINKIKYYLNIKYLNTGYVTTYLAKTIFPINLCILETVNFYTQTEKLISLNINVLFRITTTILTRPRWAVGQRVTPLHGYRAVNGDLPRGLWMRAHSLGCLWPGLFWGPGICWMLVRLTRTFLTVCLLITAPSWTIQWKKMYTY